MNFRIYAFSLIVSFSLFQCASQKNKSGAWQKSVEETYYNIWSTGMAPAGTGANFFVKFSKAEPITVKSFVVNGETLEVEITQTDTETLVIGRRYTGPDLEKKNQEMPEFYKQQNFSGTLVISNNNKNAIIQISSFEHRQLEQNNL